jgi:phosphate transport system substrate-binding protein
MRRLLLTAAAAVLCAGPFIAAPAASAVIVAPSAVTAQINGSGSTWSENAINQWISDVTAKGLVVVFTGQGSAVGRADFRNRTTDFAVSDIGFQGADAANGGAPDTSCTDPTNKSSCRPYVYLPIVAGGTTFPYQVRVAGQLVVSLRLSGQTVTNIFTNHITNWDDPAIAKDNNHRFFLANGSSVTRLPSLAITPVVHSEGSGSTAQFTLYMDTMFRSIWRNYSGLSGMTEYYPVKGTNNMVTQNGSDGMINFVTSAAANGAIGYDEYSYALQKNWPVAQLENAAGYFTAPTQYDVAVALTKAQINLDKSSPNYLLQNLNKVYTNPDKRAYAMSSYSYMIIPTSKTDPRMSTPKRQTLAEFIDWSVCGGQREMGPIGYSPLPINLAQDSFDQMYKLHTADPAVQISSLNVATKCNNPTFWAGHSADANFLAHIAPQPPTCDQSGQGPCGPGTGVGPTGNPSHGQPPPSNNSPSPGASTSTSPGAGSSNGLSGGSSTGTGSSNGGLPGSSNGSTSGGSNNGTGSENLTETPTALAQSEGSGLGGLLAVLVAVEVLLLLALPPIIARRRQRRTGR